MSFMTVCFMSLVDFQIGSNPLTTEGAMSLLKLIQHTPTMKLEELDLAVSYHGSIDIIL